MTFRPLTYALPALGALLLAGVAAAPANAAPVQKATFDGGQMSATLVDHRDGRWRGDRDRGRHWRGRGDRRDRYWRGGYSRPYYRPYRPPRYVYGPPPVYYYPYETYYPYNYFSYSSPGFGFSFGY